MSTETTRTAGGLFSLRISQSRTGRLGRHRGLLGGPRLERRAVGSINQSKKTDGRKEREMRRVESPEKRRKMKDRLENSNGAIVFFFF